MGKYCQSLEENREGEEESEIDSIETLKLACLHTELNHFVLLVNE